MIAVQNVSKFLGKKELFREVSFHIHPADRIGIVGPNGAGKTTLFRILLGDLEPDEGEISRSKNIRMGYLPQQWNPTDQKTVLDHVQSVHRDLHSAMDKLREVELALSREKNPDRIEALAIQHAQLTERIEALGGYDLEARARKILAGLGFSDEDMERPVHTLSGGWAMRAELGRLLLAEPDVLLLDEPTNHLDLESMLWLESFIQTTRSAVLLVSHDRTFLNRVVHRILEVENGRVEHYNGNYDRYVEEKSKRLEIAQAAYRNQQERIRQIERFIARNRVRKDRARQVQSRLKMLEKMERIEAPSQEVSVQFHFPDPPRCGKRVFELQNVSKHYGERAVYEGVDLVVERGDRIAVLGPNGTGKTTLLKILAGREPVTSGEVKTGHQVRVGYYAQHLWEELHPDRTVLEEAFSVAGNLPQTQVRSLLGAFLFRNDDVSKKVRVLSGGEKARLSLCKLLLQSPNVLVLDEPTNHLDIPSRQILEDALNAYQGTLCFVSHDRRFINAVATKILVVSRTKLEVFPGNAEDYERIWKARIAATSLSESKEKTSCESAPKIQAKDRKRLEAQWRNELYRATKPLKERLEHLEKQLDQALARKESLSGKLADPATYQEEGNDVSMLQQAYRECERQIQELTNQWEKTAEELENLEQEFWRNKENFLNQPESGKLSQARKAVG